MFSFIKYWLAKKSFEKDMKKVEELVLLSSLYNIKGNEINLLKIALEEFPNFNKEIQKTFFDGNLMLENHDKKSKETFSPESIMDAYRKISHYIKDDMIFKSSTRIE